MGGKLYVSVFNASHGSGLESRQKLHCPAVACPSSWLKEEPQKLWWWGRRNVLHIIVFHLNWGKAMTNLAACVPDSKKINFFPINFLNSISFHFGIHKLWLLSGHCLRFPFTFLPTLLRGMRGIDFNGLFGQTFTVVWIINAQTFLQAFKFNEALHKREDKSSLFQRTHKHLFWRIQLTKVTPFQGCQWKSWTHFSFSVSYLNENSLVVS